MKSLNDIINLEHEQEDRDKNAEDMKKLTHSVKKLGILLKHARKVSGKTKAYQQVALSREQFEELKKTYQ